MAEGTQATPGGGTHPSAGQSPQFEFYFHSGGCRENYRQAKRGLHNLVLRCGTRLALGQRLFQSRLLRTACQTDALARTKLQSHAAGTGPIAIVHIKNNAPQHDWAFPISPTALLPAELAFVPPPIPHQLLLSCQPLMKTPRHQSLSSPTIPLPASLLLHGLLHPRPRRAPSPALPAQPLVVLTRLRGSLFAAPCMSPVLSPCSSHPAFPLLPLPTEIQRYLHIRARVSVSVCCLHRPQFNAESNALERQRVITWHLNRTARQTDGTSCSSFPQETGVTCENCAHHTVPEKDVSSPTFNSGISRANGIKHALKAFEGTIFQLLFSMPDDSVVESISPGDAVNRESQGRERPFPSSMLGKQKVG